MAALVTRTKEFSRSAPRDSDASKSRVGRNALNRQLRKKLTAPCEDREGATQNLTMLAEIKQWQMAESVQCKHLKCAWK